MNYNGLTVSLLSAHLLSTFSHSVPKQKNRTKCYLNNYTITIHIYTIFIIWNVCH
jgi:hypothetical protein